MRSMNLLPPEYRTRSGKPDEGRHLKPVHGLTAVGAIVVVGMLGAWGMARQDASEARTAEAEAVALAAAAQSELNVLQPVVELDRRRQSRETAVLSLAQGRTDWSMVLSSVAGSLPTPVGITQLTASAGGDTSGGVSAPAGLQGQGSVTLVGCADTQPRVARALRSLGRLPQVADVALTETSRTNAKGASSGANCTGVAMNAAVGLAPTTILDPATAGKADAAAAGAVAPTNDPTTTASAADPTGSSR